MRIIYKLWFKSLSFKFEGEIPKDLPKYIIVVAPHTANLDFFIGLAVRSILQFKSYYLAKSQLFKPPFGFIFRWLGGYPVDRSKFNRLVEAVVDIFNSKEVFSIAIAPEGTRKKVKKIKTGFYHISRKAKVPIILMGFDYGNRKIRISDPFLPSNNAHSDFTKIINFFSECKGVIPENGVSPDVLDNMKTEIERIQKTITN